MKRLIDTLLLSLIAALCGLKAVAADPPQLIKKGSLPFRLAAKVADVPLSWTIADSASTYEWRNMGEQKATTYDGQKLKFLMKATFTVDSAYNEPIYVCMPPTRYVCRGYINGNLFMQRGDEAVENASVYNSTSYILPQSVVRRGQPNELILELVTFNGNRTLMPVMRMADKVAANKFVRVRQTFNIYIPFALLVIGIFNSLFFTVVFFVSHRLYKKLRFALFALMSLCFALTYVDYALTSNFANYGLLAKVSSVAYMLSLVLSTVFVFEYFDVIDRWKRVRTTLLVLVFGAAAGYIVWAVFADVYAVANTFNLWTAEMALPLSVVNVSLSLYYTVKHFKIRNAALLIANIVMAAGLTYDNYVGDFSSDIGLTATSMLLMIFTLQGLFIVDYERLLNRVKQDTVRLQHQNEKMERTIEERTHELTENNSKLNAVVRQLREANAVKDRFFSIMAHDIKNPLGAIMGFSDLIVKHHDDYDSEDLMEFCREINTGAYGLHKMLENLLEWSRVQIGTIKCTPVWFEASLIENTLKPVMSATATSKGIQLKFVSDEGARIYGDENMTITICRNLIANAIKFSYPGSEVTLAIDSSSAEATVITITDHGVGMTEKQISRLFKIDEVSSTPGTNQEQGSGLGLILCNEFALRQHGTITVESEPGKGSRFIVSLPKQAK